MARPLAAEGKHPRHRVRGHELVNMSGDQAAVGPIGPDFVRDPMVTMNIQAFPTSSKASTASEYALGTLPRLSRISASPSSRRAFLVAATAKAPSASRSGTGIVLAIINEATGAAHGQASPLAAIASWWVPCAISATS